MSLGSEGGVIYNLIFNDGYAIYDIRALGSARTIPAYIINLRYRSYGCTRFKLTLHVPRIWLSSLAGDRGVVV